MLKYEIVRLGYQMDSIRSPLVYLVNRNWSCIVLYCEEVVVSDMLRRVVTFTYALRFVGGRSGGKTDSWGRGVR